MEPFTHSSFIGDFLDVLSMNSPLTPDNDDVCVSHFGATTNQEAVLSRYFGDLTLNQTPDFAASLDSLLSAAVRLVVLDFSTISSICPNAVAALVNFTAGVQGRGKKLILFRPGPALRQALDSLGLMYLFSVLDSEEELLIALPD